MGCCLLLIMSFIGPRVAIVVMWLFTNYLSDAYGSFWWPFLGFFFLPWTTIAYAVAVNAFDGLHGWGLAFFMAGLALDVWSWAAGSERRPGQPRSRRPYSNGGYY
jgi:hypothetical protein